MPLLTGHVVLKSVLASSAAAMSLSGLLLIAEVPDGSDAGVEAPAAEATLRLAECPERDAVRASLTKASAFGG